MRFFIILCLAISLVACAGMEVKPKGEVVVGVEVGKS